MVWALGNVKSHVKTSANYYGTKYGIKTIYGVSGGSVATSDHPKGLALDFMINNIPNGAAVGNALANELLGDPNVTYVIWNRQINTKDGRGWRKYNGPRPHTDHVHASYRPTGTPYTGAGSAVVPVGGSPLVPDSVEKLATFLSAPGTWRRLAFYMAGSILIIVGVILMAGQSSVGQVVKAVAK